MKLTVAHLDHGMRADSVEDRRLVQAVAGEYGLPFVYERAELGARASEAEARAVRYEFLRRVAREQDAQAVVTAHHRDDVLETAIINILRGTGRKGLSALGSRPGLERPLLGVPKSGLLAYAREQGLRWREDSTNRDMEYLRNYVRHQLLGRFQARDRERLWDIIVKVRETNREIDTLLVNCLHFQSVTGSLDRIWFSQLPHTAAREVMAAWLRAHGVRHFDRKALERLVVAAKVAAPGRKFAILQGLTLRVEKDKLALVRPER